MRKKLFKIGIAVAGLVVTTAIVAGATYAQNNFGNDSLMARNHQTVLGTVDVDDFDSWKQDMTNRGVDVSLLTEDNFAKMKEAHKLMEEGKTDEAKKIHDELSELGFWPRGRLNRGENKENMEAIKTALDNKDYQTWKEAVGEERAAEVTEDEFPKLLEAHQLMQEAQEKMEQARIIREEIGLKGGPHGMMK